MINHNLHTGRHNISQTDELVSLIINGEFEIFRDQLNEPCIVDKKVPFVARRINSEETKRLLSKIYWDIHSKSLRVEIINSAVITLNGIAQYGASKKEVSTRVAKVGDNIYYDIGDDNHVIHITEEGWNIENNAPVYFRRFTHQLAQSLPRRRGNLKLFSKYINISGETNQILLLTYLPTCLISDIERPLLLIHGPQGAGKSTALELIRSIIDPSRLPLLQPPKKSDDMVQQANKHYAYFMDNVSKINRQISNELCRLVTGSAFSKRALYTNDDDYIYEMKRVTGFTSIAQLASNADLLDRSLIIELDMIDETSRKSESILNREFEEEKPFIIGGLFDAVSASLKLNKTLSLGGFPRLADYYKHAAASAVYLGYSLDKFKAVYRFNKQQQDKEAVDASSIIQTILILMKSQKQIREPGTKLYIQLKEISEKYQLTLGFPMGPTTLWKRIQEAKATLVSIGINPEKSRDSNSRYIILTKTDKYESNLNESLPDIESGGPLSDTPTYQGNQRKTDEFLYHTRINPKTKEVEIIKQTITHI